MKTSVILKLIIVAIFTFPFLANAVNKDGPRRKVFFVAEKIVETGDYMGCLGYFSGKFDDHSPVLKAGGPEEDEDLLNYMIYYSSGMTDPLKNEDSALKVFYEYMINHIECKIQIIGYCDATYSDMPFNRISYERAIKVADYFYENGINPKRIFVKSYGKMWAAEDNHIPEKRQYNRRVSLRVVNSGILEGSTVLE